MARTSVREKRRQDHEAGRSIQNEIRANALGATTHGHDFHLHRITHTNPFKIAEIANITTTSLATPGGSRPTSRPPGRMAAWRHAPCQSAPPRHAESRLPCGRKPWFLGPTPNRMRVRSDGTTRGCNTCNRLVDAERLCFEDCVGKYSCAQMARVNAPIAKSKEDASSDRCQQKRMYSRHRLNATLARTATR